VNYPQTYSWNGTKIVQTTGPAYTYFFDAMMRPVGLKDQSNNSLCEQRYLQRRESVTDVQQ
jgi:hypothetical protein